MHRTVLYGVDRERVGESPERKKVRFLPDSGDGGVAAVTVEELVEGRWSDEHGQRQMFEGLPRWGPTWIQSTQKLHWIVCWKMELCATFHELKVLA